MFNRKEEVSANPSYNITQEEFDTMRCVHCGGAHLRACPRVRRLIFEPSTGKIVEVEFWSEGEWSDDSIIWPEEIVEEEDD